MTHSAPQTVSFRIDERTACELAKRAKSYGISPHELARNCLATILAEGEERTQLLVALEMLLSQFDKLREDIATGFVAILVRSELATDEEAREWAKENF